VNSKSNSNASTPISKYNIHLFKYDLENKEELMEKLIVDVKKFKVSLPDNFNSKQLINVSFPQV
jgi:hypothetical protein